jgi:hypothetical protein
VSENILGLRLIFFEDGSSDRSSQKEEEERRRTIENEKSKRPQPPLSGADSESDTGSGWRSHKTGRPDIIGIY